MHSIVDQNGKSAIQLGKELCEANDSLLSVLQALDSTLQLIKQDFSDMREKITLEAE